MRQRQGIRRSQPIWLLLAAAAGYLLGHWNASVPRSAEFPEQMYPQTAAALRFQEDFAPAAAAQTSTANSATAPRMILGNAQLALFEPEPLMPGPELPVPAAAPAAPSAQTEPSVAHPSSTETADLSPAVETPAVQAAPPAQEPAQPTEAAKRHPASSRPARRPHYLFDDAQLAGIKRRLHLTRDQERMWPAVAVALRHIGIERERETRRGESGAIDPNSEAVQDLKSAAIPLLMSFSDEQKDEVRNLARNMGLDELASEF